MGAVLIRQTPSIQHNWVQMVREIKASLVSHASLIQAMTPNLAAARSNSGMPDLPSYSAPESPSMMPTFTHRVPCYWREGVLQICQ